MRCNLASLRRYAFSIWGIIFTLQGAGCLVAWLPTARWAHVQAEAIGEHTKALCKLVVPQNFATVIQCV